MPKSKVTEALRERAAEFAETLRDAQRGVRAEQQQLYRQFEAAKRSEDEELLWWVEADLQNLKKTTAWCEGMQEEIRLLLAAAEGIETGRIM